MTAPGDVMNGSTIKFGIKSHKDRKEEDGEEGQRIIDRKELR